MFLSYSETKELICLTRAVDLYIIYIRKDNNQAINANQSKIMQSHRN